MGNNSCTTDAVLMTLYVHSCMMVINIFFKFHEITIIGYFVLAHFSDFQSSVITHAVPNPA